MDEPRMAMSGHRGRPTTTPIVRSITSATVAAPSLSRLVKKTRNMPLVQTQLVDGFGRPLSYEAPSPLAMHNSYHNAKRDRTRQGTRGPLGSVNAHHDKKTLDDLIRDCTALSRNSIIAEAIETTAVDCVVGPEIIADPRTADKAWNADVQRRFGDWGESRCDITGQMTFTDIAGDFVRSWFDAGGKIAHKVVENGRYCKIETIEVVRLMNEAGRMDTRDMIGGVQINSVSGRPTKYWIADWNEQGTALDYKPEPYDATHMWLVNNPRLREGGQYRTAPRFAKYIDKIEALETADKSTLGAYQLQTFMALFITRNHPEGVSHQQQLAQAQVNAGLANSVDEAVDRGVWEPMSVMEGQPGEGVQPIMPTHPSTGWDVMWWTELQTVCGALGYPLELVFFRFIRNWSASKSAISAAWQGVKKDQKALKSYLLRPVYEWWLANEIRQGRISDPGEDWNRVEFILPQQPVLDPKIEAEALSMQLASGLKLHRTALAEFGQGDRDTFMESFATERTENEAAGLSYSRPKAEFKSESTNTVEDGDGNPEDGDA